ncbi:MAG: hypothetical protein WD771_09095 [Gemmatimonadaceae bacterium]
MPEFPLPEFTRSLRALAVPSEPGSDHDLIFAPLIQARTMAHRASSLEAQLAAFDATRLERAWRSAILALAEARHKRSPPDQRALAAELEILAGPLWGALVTVRVAADAAKAATRDDRRAAWERWVATIQQLFRAADDWWHSALGALSDSRGRRGALWRGATSKAR